MLLVGKSYTACLLQSIAAALYLLFAPTTASTPNTLNFTGLATGSKIEVLWHVPEVWSVCTVDSYDKSTFMFKVTYDSGFETESFLPPQQWRMREKPGAPDMLPMKEIDAKEEGEALVGKDLRVFWPEYNDWQQGTLGKCKAVDGSMGNSCDFYKEDDEEPTEYDFSDPELQWRHLFTPDPNKWTLPKDPMYNDALNLMEIDVDTTIMEKVRHWYEHHILPGIDGGDVFNSTTLNSTVFIPEVESALHPPKNYSWYRQFAGVFNFAISNCVFLFVH